MIAPVPLWIVDAFTDRPFAGNPAGVCLLERPADPGWMQALAAELGLSETAFVVPSGSGEPMALRWFSPTVEVDLCGHATLASAHASRELGRFDPGRHGDGPLRFATRSGVLSVRGGEHDRLVLELPVSACEAVEAPPGLGEALGCPVVQVAAGRGRSGLSGSTDLLVELADERAVAALDPEPHLLARFEHRAIVVTAPADGGVGAVGGVGGDGSDGGDDYVLRVFGPRVGIPEDPATGSAHCLLAPLWAERLGQDHMTARQLSPRGASFDVRLRPGIVEVGGSAVTVVRGEVEPVDDRPPG